MRPSKASDNLNTNQRKTESEKYYKTLVETMDKK